MPSSARWLLYGAACALWEALEPGAPSVTLTSGCVSAASCATAAEQYDAWELLDPEAAEYVRDVRKRVRREGHVLEPENAAVKYRIPEADPVGQARWYDAWEAAANWLRSAHLEDYHHLEDRPALAKAVRRYRAPR